MTDPHGALLVAGATSDAGKSTVVAGLCRLLARRGVSVAPFKAQNMSNNSVVTVDGGEIGRAQALQAEACGIDPTVDLNPVLLKPGGDRSSQLVVRGKAVAQVSSRDYVQHRRRLAYEVSTALAHLRSRYDVVVCEGAGSPAEINLRATDLANMGLARAAGLPTVVVGDIDRGGVLSHLAGTLGVLGAEDQALIHGFLVNKFRGDRTLLEPGLDMLTELTGRPVFGVLPFLDGLWIDAEDSLGSGAGGTLGRPGPPLGTEALTVAVIRFPRVSNSTDVEALACEPGVHVHWADHPAQLSTADLVVLPGSKATVSDLAWLRERGLDRAVLDHAGSGRPVLGICAGFQMLGRRIRDGVEQATDNAVEVAALGVLDVDFAFHRDKVLRRVDGVDHTDGVPIPVSGYEIHHGRVVRCAESPMLDLGDGRVEGARSGAVYGTHWHGLFASDGYRRRFVAEVARQAGRRGFVVAPDTSVTRVRAAQLDLIADAVEEHVDTGALLRVAEDGPHPGLPRLDLVRSDRR